MAVPSVAHEEIYDDLTTLRGRSRRQERAIADLSAEVTSLKALTANLTAAVAALVGYLEPRDGEWVCEEGQPPEWEPIEPKAPTSADFTALLYEIPAELLRNGRNGG